MPFSGRTLTPQGIAPWEELYNDHIKPAVEALGLRCFRADEIVRPGSIIADVVEAVASAFLVVAEMTGQNANVFYELGVRHALSKRTILLSQAVDDIPFDLRDCRTITYSFTPRGAKHLEDSLRATVAEVIASPDHSDNPVQAFLDNTARTRGGAHAVEGALDMQSSIAALQRQNGELADAVNQLKQLMRFRGEESLASDLLGTWTDEFIGVRVLKYFAAVDGQLVMAYGGSWPGCAFGRFDGQVYRFDWSRFDSSLNGSGVLRVVSPTRLEGGLWFGSDADGEPLERHVLTRHSLEVSPPGPEWIDTARRFMASTAATADRRANQAFHPTAAVKMPGGRG